MDQNKIWSSIKRQLQRISTSKRFQDNTDHSRIYLRYKKKKIAIFSWYHSSKKLLSKQGDNFQVVNAAEHYVFKIGFAYDRNTLKHVFNAEEGDVLAKIIPEEPF
jgi:hypothetical protein